jgi:hypothetical protein
VGAIKRMKLLLDMSLLGAVEGKPVAGQLDLPEGLAVSQGPEGGLETAPRSSPPGPLRKIPRLAK